MNYTSLRTSNDVMGNKLPSMEMPKENLEIPYSPVDITTMPTQLRQEGDRYIMETMVSVGVDPDTAIKQQEEINRLASKCNSEYERGWHDAVQHMIDILETGTDRESDL